MTVQNAEYPTEQPSVRLAVKLHERKDITSIELVSLGPVLLPSLPLRPVAHPKVQRMMVLVVTSKMNLVVRNVLERPDILQQKWMLHGLYSVAKC